MKSRLYKKYEEQVVPGLMKEFNLKNKLAAPRILKVSVNVGINARNTDSSYLDTVVDSLAKITGQRPVKTKAKKAISAFKVRENMIVGVKVTLRGQKMYDFIDRLVNISIPRIRDFRGLPVKNIDKQGNLTLGFKEHNVFPEIRAEEVDKVHGLEISIATTAKNEAQGLALFRALGFPFQK